MIPRVPLGVAARLTRVVAADGVRVGAARPRQPLGEQLERHGRAERPRPPSAAGARSAATLGASGRRQVERQVVAQVGAHEGGGGHAERGRRAQDRPRALDDDLAPALAVGEDQDQAGVASSAAARWPCRIVSSWSAVAGRRAPSSIFSASSRAVGVVDRRCRRSAGGGSGPAPAPSPRRWMRGPALSSSARTATGSSGLPAEHPGQRPRRSASARGSRRCGTSSGPARRSCTTWSARAAPGERSLTVMSAVVERRRRGAPCSASLVAHVPPSCETADHQAAGAAAGAQLERLHRCHPRIGTPAARRASSSSAARDHGRVLAGAAAGE